jgi:tripartite-type tricarboxylate transporter receptor subunit TctC
LRGLAVLSEKRSPEFPDVPTVSETYPECVAYPWTALHVRAETPDDVTAKLAEAVQKVLAMPEMKAYAAKTPGTELMPLGPVAMQQYHLAERTRFRQIAEKAGIKAE